MVWFLWWIATKCSQKADVSHDCCDLSSVSYFICSQTAMEYLTIKWSNIGWVFLWGNAFFNWENYFLHLVKVQVPNAGGASRQRTYCCQGKPWVKENEQHIIISRSLPSCMFLVWVPKCLPRCPLRWLFAISSSRSCTWGRGSRARFIAKTRET